MTPTRLQEVFYMGPITQNSPADISHWASHAVVVPEWMNAAREHPSFFRVSKLVSKLRSVQAEVDAYPDEEALLTCDEVGTLPIPPPVQKALCYQDEIVGVLSEYSASLGVEHSLDGKSWNLPIVPNPIPGEFILQRQCYLKDGNVSEELVDDSECVSNLVGEGDVVFRIKILAQSGKLHRLRACRNPECTNWFYAFSTKKVYCKRACQVAHNISSPIMKRKRSDYKRIRWLEEKERQSKMNAARYGRSSD